MIVKSFEERSKHWQSLVCGRCGERFNQCPHTNTARKDIDKAWALRIKAAYALGKRHNPDHDKTSYADQTRSG